MLPPDDEQPYWEVPSKNQWNIGDNYWVVLLKTCYSGGRRGMTCSSSPVIYCCKKNSVTPSLRNSFTLPVWTYSVPSFEETSDSVYLFFSSLWVHDGFNWKKANSRNIVPQLVVSKRLATGVGEVIELPQWGTSYWWKLGMLFFFFFLVRS